MESDLLSRYVHPVRIRAVMHPILFDIRNTKQALHLCILNSSFVITSYPVNQYQLAHIVYLVFCLETAGEAATERERKWVKLDREYWYLIAVRKSPRWTCMLAGSAVVYACLSFQNLFISFDCGTMRLIQWSVAVFHLATQRGNVTMFENAVFPAGCRVKLICLNMTSYLAHVENYTFSIGDRICEHVFGIQ